MDASESGETRAEAGETQGQSEDSETEDSETETDGGETEEGETDTPPPDMPPEPDPNEQIPPPDAEGCHAIYAQDQFPEFELVIQSVVWEQLQQWWNEGQELEDDPEIDVKDYLPLQAFRYQHPGYEAIEITDAEIRLRGNPSNWDPLPDDKMQFQIGFHTNDEDGRFLGLKRILFDAATYNRHMLRDRLALSVIREAGVRAPCANNAKLWIDLEYPNPADEAELGQPFFYGVFTNVEKMDETYLERAWEDPTGDLWKRANWELKTNLDTSNDDRIDDMRDAETVEELYSYMALEDTLRAFAVDAVLPNSDGMWAGGLNYYFYDDPLQGKFVMVPWDLDNVFERFDDGPEGPYPVNPDPVVWEKGNTHGRPFYDLALTDPQWFDDYIEEIGLIVEHNYTPDKLHTRIDTWTAQIRDDVYLDEFKSFSNDKYDDEVEELHEYVQQRYEFMVEWMSCWEGGGSPDDQGYCVPAP